MNVQRSIGVALIGWLCACAPPVTRPMEPEPPTLEVPTTSASEPWRLPRLSVRAAGGDDTVVQLFVSSNCSGPELLRRPIEAFRAGVELDTVHGTNVFSAAALTRSGLRSRCSAAASVEVRLPMRGPSSGPDIRGIAPQTPTKERFVRLTGFARPGWTVRVWSKPDCDGVVLASGEAAAFVDGPGLEVPLPFDAAIEVSLDAVRGFELTQCGTVATRLQNDSTPPTFAAEFFPRPPHPFLSGAIVVSDLEVNAVVRLVPGKQCGDASVAPSGTAYCDNGRCAWLFFPLQSDAELSLWATDTVGNESPCVTLEQQLTTQGNAPTIPLWRWMGRSRVLVASPVDSLAAVFDGPDCTGNAVFGISERSENLTLLVVTDLGSPISARLTKPPEGTEFPCVRIR